MSAEPSIALAGVSAGYWTGEPVLDGVTLTLSGYRWLHLGAPNGVGKSTLFEVVAGYLAPTAGTVTVGGEPVRSGRRVAGVRVQRSEPALVPGVTLRDHLHLHGTRYGEPVAALEELAILLGLRDHLDKTPESLSTGSLKKAWFVCHAAGTPPVWLLDEPFNGVDAESVEVMSRLLSAHPGLVVTTSHQLPGCVDAGPTEPAGESPFVVRELRWRG